MDGGAPELLDAWQGLASGKALRPRIKIKAQLDMKDNANYFVSKESVPLHGSARRTPPSPRRRLHQTVIFYAVERVCRLNGFTSTRRQPNSRAPPRAEELRVASGRGVRQQRTLAPAEMPDTTSYVQSEGCLNCSSSSFARLLSEPTHWKL